jgi:hypothetical protein
MTKLTEFDLTKIMAALQTIQKYGAFDDNTDTPKRYYLDPVKNKKMGFVWYVRYLDNGVVIPSHWTTGTNDRKEAEKFAVENRGKLLNKYFGRNCIKKPYGELYIILRKYYSDKPPYLEIDAMRGRSINEHSRVTYHNLITKQFIPLSEKKWNKRN